MILNGKWEKGKKRRERKGDGLAPPARRGEGGQSRPARSDRRRRERERERVSCSAGESEKNHRSCVGLCRRGIQVSDSDSGVSLWRARIESPRGTCKPVLTVFVSCPSAHPAL